MLEQDYLNNDNGRGRLVSAPYKFDDPRLKELNTYSSQLIRELIIPKLIKEVNTSKRYAPLRQVYYSLILASWFKARNQGKDNQYARIIDRKDLTNLASKESWSKDTYFNAYQKSFKDGEYNIQEPVYTPYGQTIRSYFSGGIANLAPAVAPRGSVSQVDSNVTMVLVEPAARELPADQVKKLVSAEAEGTADPDGLNIITGQPQSPAALREDLRQKARAALTGLVPGSDLDALVDNLLDAIVQAHLVGKDGQGVYTEKEIGEKTRILERRMDELGLNKDKKGKELARNIRRALMEKGVAGIWDRMKNVLFPEEPERIPMQELMWRNFRDKEGGRVMGKLALHLLRTMAQNNGDAELPMMKIKGGRLVSYVASSDHTRFVQQSMRQLGLGDDWNTAGDAIIYYIETTQRHIFGIDLNSPAGLKAFLIELTSSLPAEEQQQARQFADTASRTAQSRAQQASIAMGRVAINLLEQMANNGGNASLPMMGIVGGYVTQYVGSSDHVTFVAETLRKLGMDEQLASAVLGYYIESTQEKGGVDFTTKQGLLDFLVFLTRALPAQDQERARRLAMPSAEDQSRQKQAKEIVGKIAIKIIQLMSQRDGHVFLPFIEIRDGQILQLIYDRRAIDAFRQTLAQLGFHPSLAPEVAATFEDMVTEYPYMITINSPESVRHFLKYLTGGLSAAEGANEAKTMDSTSSTDVQSAFSILGLDSGSATIEDVKAAFRNKARETHPDKTNGTDSGLFIRTLNARNLCISYLESQGPRSHSGYSGNEVDDQFIQAQKAIQGKDITEAKRRVSEAIRLLREIDFDALDDGNLPIADMVNQTAVAIWVLEQLQSQGLLDQDAAELLKQLQAGINGLELKQAMGYKGEGERAAAQARPGERAGASSLEITPIEIEAAGTTLRRIAQIAEITTSSRFTDKGFYGNLSIEYLNDFFKAAGLSRGDKTVILDAGSGQGFFDMLLAHFLPNAMIYGIEFDPQLHADGQTMLMQAIRSQFLKAGQAVFTQGDFNKEKFGNFFREADVIYYYGIGSSDENTFAKTLIMNMKPGARLIVFNRVHELRPLLEASGLFTVSSQGRFTIFLRRQDAIASATPDIASAAQNPGSQVIDMPLAETQARPGEAAAAGEKRSASSPVDAEKAARTLLEKGQIEIIAEDGKIFTFHIDEVVANAFRITVRDMDNKIGRAGMVGYVEFNSFGIQSFFDQTVVAIMVYDKTYTGIGRALVSLALAISKIKNPGQRYFSTIPVNEEARQFYRDLGFKLDRFDLEVSPIPGILIKLRTPPPNPPKDGSAVGGIDPSPQPGSIPSASETTTAAAAQTRTGGIDFRSLPIVTQAIGNLRMNMDAQAINRMHSKDVSRELEDIQRMIEAGISPSGERIKEYVQASAVQGNLDIDKVISCISDILRSEEERCCQTEAVIKDILVVLESARSKQELKEIFVGKT